MRRSAMRALKWALLVAVSWFALLAFAAWLHTEVLLKGQITPAEDNRISYLYGQVAAAGAVFSGLATFVLVMVVWPPSRK
jgi:hypothetical protein